MTSRGAWWVFVRSEVRRRRAGYVGLALVVALGGTAALSAFVAASRTARAYPDAVARNEVEQLVVNPSMASEQFDREIRRLPGVEQVRSDGLLLASALSTEPGRLGDMLARTDDAWTQVRGSSDGRYTALDRPVVTSGELLSGPREVFVSDEYRPVLERGLGHALRVGDEMTLAFYWAGTTDSGLEPDDVVTPIGVEHLRVAGFGVLPDEALPEGLFPRQRMIVSADVAQRYDCTVDVSTSKGEGAIADYFPRTCSMQYRYYSLRLAPGVSAVEMRRRLSDLAARLTPTIAPVLRDQGLGYEVISQDRTDLDRAVAQTTRPTVVALAVFGGAALLATVALVALGASRLVRRAEPDLAVLRGLGASRPTRVRWAAAPLAIAAAAGLVVATVACVFTAPLSPVGTVRRLVPSPGPTFEAGVSAIVVAVAAVLLGAVVVLTAWRSAAADGRSLRTRRGDTATTRAMRGGSPARSRGLGAATGRGGASLALAEVLAVAAVAGATIFGTTLTHVADQPVRFGWPWSTAVMTGAGYGSAAVDRIDGDLRGVPDIERYAYYSVEATTQVGGRAVSAVFGYDGAEELAVPVIRGRAAQRAGEMVVGTATFDQLGLHLGDRVTIESNSTALDHATVVGTAVLPSLGPFQADRAGLGRGAFVLTGEDPQGKDANPAFVGIRLRPGADVRGFGERVRGWSSGWDREESPVVYAEPVRPPEILNIDAMRFAPLAVAATMALGIVIGTALALSVSVRDRRRELALLRALGFTGRELRATIGWQVAATTVVGLVVGLPVGVVVGRATWGAFARQIGLAPRADISLGWLAVLGLATVVLGAVAALPAARSSVRLTTVDQLRTS